MSLPVLLGAPASPYVRKTRLYLHERGIEHDLKIVSPRSDDPDFTRISPLGKIPAWQDDQLGISDSSVIIQYLERSYPDSSLFSNKPADAARALWFEEYADSHLTTILGSHLYAEIVLAKVFFGRDPIQSDIDLAIEKELPQACAYLESQLTDAYFIGDTFSFADLAIASIFVNLWHCGYRLSDIAGNYPALQDWFTRVYQRPAFADIIVTEKQLLGQLGYDSPIDDYLPH